MLREVQQTFQIKLLGDDTGTATECIVGVTVLLDMRRNHQQRLAQIHRLADRLEAGSGGIGLAACHVAQELDVIELMETQGVVHTAHLGFVLLVPEEVEGYFRMGTVPVEDILAKTGVYHVSVEIIPFRTFARQHLPPQQWRNHADIRFFVILHLAEGKGELFAGTYAREAGEKAEQPQMEAVLTGKLEIAVQEQVLVPDAYLRNGRTEEEIGHPREQFVEVDDQFGTTLLDAAVYIVHAFQIDGQTGEIIGHTTRKTCPLVGRRRQEIGTEKTFHRSLDAAVEETGQTARIAFAHQHFHYLVTVAAQQLFHCYGLGQMPAAFSLNDKKDFH